jgi:hypothetical protein
MDEGAVRAAILKGRGSIETIRVLLTQHLERVGPFVVEETRDAPGDHTTVWERVHVLSPNDIMSGKATARISCTK